MKRWSYNPIVQLSLSKVRELLREPEALFWVFVFPVILTVALGIAFRTGGQEELAVGVQSGPGHETLVTTLEATEGLRPVALDSEEAHRELRAGRVALVVIADDPVRLWYDPARAEGRLARLRVDNALQTGAGRVDVVAVESREMTEVGSRYIDFLIPGIIGMNLMGTGMWGIGFYIVNARSKKLLKRLVATPMRRSHFLMGQMLGRLVFLIPEVAVVLLFARYVFGVPIRGSVFSVVFLCILGALAFAGLGLLVASRATTIEGVSGLMNVVMMPMWILSGIFFSTSRFPEIMQPLVQVLPLTAVNDALRAVMLDGASLAAVSGEVFLMGGWTTVTFATALYLFRWR